MQQPHWDKYETALLIETYWAINNKEISREKGISQLSALLRRRAKHYGLEIDDVFRNENGISWRLTEIMFFFTDGEKGTKTSELYKSICQQYRDDYTSFQFLLFDAKATNYEINNKELFQQWLLLKHDQNTVNYYLRNLQLIEKYCIDRKIIHDSLFDEEAFLQAKKAKKIVFNNKFFKLLYRSQIKMLEQSINLYCSFLNHLSSVSEEVKKEYEKKALSLSKRTLSEKNDVAENIFLNDPVSLENQNDDVFSEEAEVFDISINESELLENSTIVSKDDSKLTEVSKQGKKESFFDIYNISPELVGSVPLSNYNFSVRTKNCLQKSNILTVSDLLGYNRERLLNIRNMGATSLNEVIRFIESFADSVTSTENEVSQRHSIKATSKIKDNKEAILNKDFSFVDDSFSEEELDKIEQYKNAYEDLTSGIINSALNNPKMVLPIMNALNTYSYNYQKMRSLIETIPNARQNISVNLLLTIYSDSVIADYIKKHFIQSDFKVCEIPNNIKLNSGNYMLFNYIFRFLDWCQYDLKKMSDKFFDKIIANKNRDLEVVRLRAQGLTLEEVGTTRGVTRERVRQLEAKCKEDFEDWEKSKRFIAKMSIDENKNFLSNAAISKYFGQNADIALYLLKKCKSSDFSYDNNLQGLFLKNKVETNNVELFIDSLPELFETVEIDNYILLADKFDLDKEIAMATIRNFFVLSGKVYHKSKLSRRIIAKYILEKYFDAGIHVYDEAEISKFNNYVIECFGETKYSNSKRAFVATIADIAILCDRGTYKPKENHYISDELLQKIISFINDYEQDLLLINTVFTSFYSELMEEGITNRYYLQGILNELCAERFTFNKDYIIKDVNAASLKDQILTFAKDNTGFFTKDDIYQRFVGISEIIITMALSDNNEIVNYFGRYIHINNLNIDENDITDLKQFLEAFIEEKPVHCSDVFKGLKKENPQLVEKLYLDNAFAVYSLLNNLFSDCFQFKDRYIGKSDFDIENKRVQIENLLNGQNLVDIDDLLRFTKEIHYAVYSVLDFLNSFNEKYLILNKQTLVSIEYLNISKADVEQMENIILHSIQESTPIEQIGGLLALLNQIFDKSDEWLIYSMLRKWSNRVEVAVSDPQFSRATPIVIPYQPNKNIANNNSTQSITKKYNKHNSSKELLEVFFLDTIPSLAGSKPVSIKVENRFEINNLKSWKDLYMSVFEMAIKNHYENIKEYIGKSFYSGKRIEIGNDEHVSMMRAPKKVDFLYIETNHNARDIARNVRFLLENCGYRDSDVQVTYVQTQDAVVKGESLKQNTTDSVTLESFASWLNQSLHYSENLASRYSQQVEKCDEFLRVHNIGGKRIVGCDCDEIRESMDALYSSYSYAALSKDEKGSFKESVEKYVRFVENKSVNKKRVDSRVLDEKSKLSKKAKKKVFNKKLIEDFEIILTKYFKNGFRLGSSIDKKKFLRFYENQLGYSYDENEIIDEVIESLCVINDGRAFCAKNLLDDSLKTEITEYIISTIKETGMIAVSQVFSEFQDSLLYTNIINEDMLCKYLDIICDGVFFIKNGFITKDESNDINVDREVENFMRSNVFPMTFDEICERLYHLESSDIKSAINSNSSIIRINKNTYCHINAFVMKESDITKIDSFIANEINTYSFVSTRHLFEMIQIRCPEILDNNEFIETDYGFRNLMKYYLGEKYSFQIVISAKNRKLVAKDIFASFAKSHERFLFSDLENLAKEIDSSLLLQPVYDNALRINQNEFVTLSRSGFDIEGIDDEIESFCAGDFIPLDTISIFMTFPQVNYPWNSFLLESYVYHYSARFKLVNHRFNKTSTTGAIVRRDKHRFFEYENILADVLAKSGVELKKEAALNYLQDKGYLSSHRYTRIDALLQSAWNERQKNNY